MRQYVVNYFLQNVIQERDFSQSLKYIKYLQKLQNISKVLLIYRYWLCFIDYTNTFIYIKFSWINYYN